MAESITEGTLKQWIKKKGDYVEADEEVATIETDKIDVTVNAPSAGTITETFAEEEDTVTVGKDLFKLEAGDKPAESESKSEEKPKEEESSKKEEAAPKKEESASAEKKEEPKKEESQPESKRKKSESSEKYEKREQEPKRDEPKVSQAKQPTPEEKSKAKESSSAAGESSPDTSKTTGSGERTERRIKLNRMRQRIAERLKQSQNTAASLTTFNEIDMTQLMEMRKLYKDKVLKDHEVKLGFMSAFGRAACIALQEIPAANASIEGPGAGEQIVYRDYVDLSVAVSTPKGLVTPVVRNADKMSFIEIERSIAELGKKARDNKLTIEDMTGGSFTISNGGVFGSLFGTPIINLPQTAVLGLHAIKDKPVVVNGEIVIRPIMVVALTYDHRLLDGREGVTLLVRIKELVEDPRRMLLSV